jgi:GNAT superfamily N-acetyltransferase
MRDTDLESTVEMIALYNAEHSLSARRTFERFLSGKLAERTEYFVAELKGNIVGCMGFEPEHDEEAQGVYWATYLFVHPAYYRRGIGSYLANAIEERIKSLGARKIYLDVGNARDQPEAIRFHMKHGYVKEGELKDFFRVGEDKLIFGKTLGGDASKPGSLM